MFVVNPQGDRTLRVSQPSQEQIRKAMEAWQATAHLAPEPLPVPLEYPLAGPGVLEVGGGS